MRNLFNTGRWALLVLAVLSLSGSSRGAGTLPSNDSEAAPLLAGSCIYALTTSAGFFSAGGGTGGVDLTAADGCAWSAVSSNSWLKINSPTNGSGNAAVSYTVGANPNVTGRTGWLSVAGQPFSITQDGIVCTCSLDPTGRVHGYAADFATFNITLPAACDWTADNTNDWMAIKLYTNGTGSGILRYSVFANDNPVPRTGSLTVNGVPFTVTQLPAPCAYSILPTNYLSGSASASGGVTVFTADGCDWSASNTNLWITMTPTNGTGGAVVSYVIAPNYSVAYRTGVVSIAGLRFTVTQLGNSCRYSLAPANNNITGFGAATGTVSVTTTTGCRWGVSTSNDWLSITPPTNALGSRSVFYSVAANPSSLARTGSLLIADQFFPITQGGVPCTYNVTPASRAHASGVESNVISVLAPLDCQWMARTTNNWITLISNTNGPGSGTLSYQLGPNPGPARTGLVFVGTARFTVTQGEAVPVLLTSPPASQKVSAGATVVFNAAASGTAPLNFQWQFNGSNLVDGPMVSGAASPRLTLPSAQPWQAGSYSVIVSNVRGPVTSAPPAVLTVNTAPVLASIGKRTVTAGAALTFRAVGVDADVPAQTLTYTLDAGAPAGASIDPATGIFTWTPAAAQAGQSYPVTFRVTDSGSPALSVSETITITVATGIIVNELNTAPVLAAIGNRNVSGGNLLTFTVSATDADLPPQTLTYRLDAGAPPGATINPVTGVFAWTPAKTQAAGAYPITIRVTDSGTPLLSAAQAISINLSQTNAAPVLVPLADKTVVRGTLLTFIATAADADLPAQTLTYSLGAGAPSGAGINPTNGIFTWAPAANAPAPSTNTVTIRVTDNGSPPLSDAKIFSITVLPTFSSNLTLIAAGSVWKYRDTGEDLGTNWTGLAFNDSAWSNGPALLGYGGGGEATVVSYGPNSSAKYITTYFRRTITVAAPSTLSPLNLGVRRDDGVVVYVNGAEVFRDNMPTGPINYLTLAAASVSGTNKTGFHVSPPVSPSYLVPGNNVVAAEVHQRSASSSSMDFDLALTAAVVKPANNVPVLGPIGNKTVDEGTPLTFTVFATDADLPAQSLTFSLDAGAPAAAGIDPVTGVFTWTPAEQDGPAAYTVTIRVTDNGSPVASASEIIRVTVNEVNVPPVLAPIGNKTIDESSLLTFTVSATDADVPAQPLTYSLDAGAPAAASIDPASGVFIWTPAEQDGPAVYAVAVRVTDNGSPPLSALEIIRVTVNEVNAPPVLAPIGNKTIDEGNVLTFTVSAADADIPAQLLTYTLDAGAPPGAGIDSATGIFTWTPAEAQGPSTNSVTIRVTDNGSPALSAFETITITVNEVNTAPVLAAIGNKNVNGGNLLMFTVSATDADLPAQTLTYSLDAGAPAGATINPATGVFAWTPAKTQAAGAYPITIRVTDSGTPVLSATQAISINLTQTNSPPALALLADKTVVRGTLLTFTATATDADLPAQTLTYSLGAGAPSGAAINPTNGIFTWTPATNAPAPSTNTVTIRVTDNGSPPLSDAKPFSITIIPTFSSNLTLIAAGSVWKYRDTGEDLGTNWSGLAFNDSAWSNGPALLGYAGGGEATVVSYGPNSSAKYITTYFRRTITVGSPSTLSPLNLGVRRDDGVVVYINGTEVYRDNMPTGPIDYLTPAATSVSGTNKTSFHVSPPLSSNYLVPGNNVVAAEVHQRSGSSSSMDFDLALTATIVRPANTVPVLAPIGNKTANEGGPLTFTASATDADVPTQSLTFSLDGVPPPGASIDPATGVFTWSPTEAQGPGVYAVTIRVTDNGSPAASASETISITVNEVNIPPVLAAIGNKTVAEGTPLTFTVSATDADLPAQSLAFSLDAGAPLGTSLDPVTGVFTWTPTEAQGPGVYAATIRVTDNASPAASASETISITVNEVNVPPVLAGIGNKTIDEGNLLTFTVSATDADVPAQPLTYTLDTGAPAGASIHPATGVFTWTPTETQGPSTNSLTVRVTDNASPALSALETITITVNEVNAAPVLAAIGNKNVNGGNLLTFTASAIDADLPAQTLTYSLDAGAPAGATINPATGVFTWTPIQAQGPSTNSVTIRVTDNGSPALSAFGTITITVNGQNTAPVLAAIGNKNVSGGNLLTFAVSATDADLPPQTLTYSLDAAPVGATINPATGVFAWTPAKTQAAGAYPITIRVTDSGTPPLSATQAISINLSQTNAAPVLVPLADKTVVRGTLLTFIATATDADLPAQTLTYSLGTGAPSGAAINPTNGIFTWTPATNAPAPSTNTVTIRVTDNGSPPLSDAKPFSITIIPTFSSNLTLIAAGSVWKYRDTGEDLGTNWTGLAFNDSAWSNGPALLGYAGGGEATVVSYGPNSSAKYITTYFRRTITVAAPSTLSPLNLSVRRDDGVVVYVNGTEVYRDNMPTGPIDYLTPAATSVSGTNKTSFHVSPPLSPNYLVSGNNVVAAEVHQRSGSSTSMDFDLALTATMVRAANTVPVLVPIGNKTANEGTPLTFTVFATDADLPAQSLAFSLDAGAPPGASLDPATGVFTWTPAEVQGPGVYAVTIRVTDNGSPAASASETITVTVNEVNVPPVLIGIGNKTIDEGSLLTFTVSATDADVPTQSLTYTLDAGAPAGASLDPASGVFTWTPSEAQGPGTNTVTIRVTDNGSPAASASETITVTVNEINTPPLLAPIGNKTVDEGTLLTFTVSATDVDLPAQSLTFSLEGVPPRAARLDPVTGVFTWTPIEEDGPAPYAVAIRVTDNGSPPLSAYAIIRVTVNEVNVPPVLAPIGNKTIDEGSLLTFTVSATDPDVPAQPLTYTLDAGAPAAASIDPATGVFTWTPAEEDGPGAYGVTIRVADNSSPAASASETITVTVNEVNVPPVLAGIGNKTIDEGNLLTFTVSATDADSPAQLVTYTLDAGALPGASIDPGTGVFTWTPAETQGPGTNSVTIRVTDNGSPALSAFETITITVNEVNTAPVLAAIGNKNVNGGNLLTFTVSATDADLPAQTLTYSLEAGASAGATLNPITGVFAWTPAKTLAPGAYPITIRVTDGGTPALSATQAISINLTQTNSPPVLALLADKTVVRGTLLTFTAAATDADLPAQTLTYSLGTGAPSGAAIDPTNGVFTWTPATNTPAPSTNTVTIRVTDNGSPPLSDAKTFAITIIPTASSNLTLIAAGSVWKYRDTGEDLGTNWSGLAFNDSAWSNGPALLGYGLGGEATVVSYGPNSSAKYITTYFRRTITAAAPSSLSTLNLSVRRDDGVVVYLNGTEVYRDNMPAGPINYLTAAATSVSGTDKTSFHVSPPLSPNYLVPGNNVVAAEVHQRSGSSTSMDFDLALTATLVNGAGTLGIVNGGINGLTPLVSITVDSHGGVSLQWSTSPGITYRLQYATDLSSNAWTNLGNDVVATGSVASATDAPAGVQQRFYRVVRLNN